MKRSTIKKVVSVAVTAMVLALPFNQASAFSMNDMIDDYTASTVTPNSRISMDGRRGFISGGSLRVRFANKPNPDLYNITLPSFKAGCNGMDMSLGSLSWISASEFMDAARAMASPSVLIYALSLALNQMCGPCAQKMSELQDQLNKYSNLLKSSCEELGTALYENSPMKEKAGQMHDYFWGDAQGHTNNDAAETQGNVVQDMLDAGENAKLSGNLVWNHMDGMQIRGWLATAAGENVAKEMIMSLSGTDITDATNAGTDDTQIKHDPRKAKPISLADIVKGGDIEGLKCNDYIDCLDVQEDVLFNLPPMADTFFEFLDPNNPNSIVTKFAVHIPTETLTNDEVAFLMAAQRHADIQKFIHSLAMSGNSFPTRTAEMVAELMAIEIALTFMLEYVDTAVSVLAALDTKTQIEPMNQFELSLKYREEADSLRKELAEKLEADANLSTMLKNALNL